MNKLKSHIYRFGYPLAVCYWFFRRPTTVGVRCIITHENKILLVRHTYGSRLWTVVGGGVEKGETFEQTAKRETAEEVGIEITDLQKIGELPYNGEFKKDTIHIFTASALNPSLQIDASEIKEAAWFALDNIPEDTSLLCTEFISMAQARLTS